MYSNGFWFLFHILKKSKDNVQYQFLEFLQALGWPVVIGQHAGWTGHMTTSWKIPDFDANTKTQSNGMDYGILQKSLLEPNQVISLLNGVTCD